MGRERGLNFHSLPGCGPGAVTPGDYRFAVGTAGSATLVLQTVLPALLTASALSTLTLEGGTYNPLATCFDFLERSFVPLLGRMGAEVELALRRPGFFPAGGGCFEVRIKPVQQWSRLTLTERGVAAPDGFGGRQFVQDHRAVFALDDQRDGYSAVSAGADPFPPGWRGNVDGAGWITAPAIPQPNLLTGPS